MNHTALMMLCWNVPHGPWAEDVRYAEVLGCFENFFKTIAAPQDSWLFMELLPRMLFDLQDPELSGHPNAADIVFERLRDENPFSTKGSKVNI